MSLIEVDSHKIGHRGYTFDNGIRVSVTFALMTYSDNYDVWKDDKNGLRAWEQPVKSKTVEIMQTRGNPAFNRWIHKKYGEYDGDRDPIAYVDVKHLPAILKRADSKVYRVTGLVPPDSNTSKDTANKPNPLNTEDT